MVITGIGAQTLIHASVDHGLSGRAMALDGALLHRSLAWAALGRMGSGRGPSTMQGHPLAVQSECCSAPSHPKQRHWVTNWAEYDAGLRARGSLTVWFTPEAVAAWAAAPRTPRGGQSSYSDLAITTALTLRAVFRLALRQTEGLIGSVLQLLNL